MNETPKLPSTIKRAASELEQLGMRGKIGLHGDATYRSSRQIWNGAVVAMPVMFALCETETDVQSVICIARRYDFPLSVRCGGHDVSGRSVRHDGIVVDLTRMRQVSVDECSQTAWVAGGATAKDVAVATTMHGLIPVTGNVGSVGMAGLALGGGYSPMTPKFGLLADNLLEARVVLANGKVLAANKSENPDLFWAVRGGGGNFGVVTAMRFRLHQVPELLAGVILFPFHQAGKVLTRFSEHVSAYPEEFGVTFGVIPGPNGRPCVMFAPNWHGARNPGEELVEELRSFGTPVVDQVGWMKYDTMLDRFEAAVVEGRHYAAATRWFARFTPDVIAASIEAIDQASSPLSFIAWHHFRGQATRVRLEDTAFGLRHEHFMMDIVAAWEPASRQSGAVHREWVSRASKALAPFAMPGGYPNMLNPDDHDQIPFAYGINRTRLCRLKKKFDPSNTFSSAIPLPAAA